MADRYMETLLTDAVKAAQRKAYGAAMELSGSPLRDELGPAEREFIAARDSFYLATVSADGWPYVQHRGGPAGFLRVVDGRTLAFADLHGNRQLLTVGNLAGNDRVSLFLIDYPARTRLKVLGRARVAEAAAVPALATQVTPADLRGKVERVMVIEVLSYDWNCPSGITPRFTAAEVEEAVAPLRQRIAELEQALARPR